MLPRSYCSPSKSRRRARLTRQLPRAPFFRQNCPNSPPGCHIDTVYLDCLPIIRAPARTRTSLNPPPRRVGPSRPVPVECALPIARYRPRPRTRPRPSLPSGVPRASVTLYGRTPVSQPVVVRPFLVPPSVRFPRMLFAGRSARGLPVITRVVTCAGNVIFSSGIKKK